jgi:hypothetical protein
MTKLISTEQAYTIHRCKKNGAAEKKVYMTVKVGCLADVQQLCEDLTREKGTEYTYLEHFE